MSQTSPPRLPAITHLQVLVLEALSDAEQAGRELRAVLAAHRVRRSAPAFYQMMARLEDAAFVEGWYEQQVVAGQHLKERRYRITPRGRRARDEARAFYRELLGASRPARKGAHA
jgi:DNA-binding PadR family transcriptional regulator